MLKEVFNSTITGKILYLKLCWTRALNHINFPKSVVELGLLIYLTLKASNVSHTIMVFALILSIILIILSFWLGHWDIKNGLMERETSLGNKFNPEIQRLLKNGKN